MFVLFLEFCRSIILPCRYVDIEETEAKEYGGFGDDWKDIGAP